jgi:TonB-linked SusC/RagA family outer membrane protein
VGAAAQESQTITGTITDEAGETIIGANVIIKGTTIGTVSDVNGQFSLKIEDRTGTLAISYLGYSSVELPIGNQTTFDIILKQDLLNLEQVIVIGYGTVRKEDLTGSISIISTEDFEVQPMVRVEDALMGRAAGVQVNRVSGAPGGEVKIRIRGANSINFDNDPLYVVDGFVGGDINSLSPTDIESINVLKDASATAIYGSRGSNGVVIVTTKMPTRNGFNVNAHAFWSSKIVANQFDLMKSAEYATLANIKTLALGGTPYFTAEEIAEFERTGSGTDWQDEVLRTGTVQNYDINFSGGSDKIKYFVSGNFADEKGTLINTNWKRYAVRSNVDAKMTDWLDFGLNLYANHEHSLNSDNLGAYGSVSVAAMWSPTLPVYQNGDYTIDEASIGTVLYNPVWLANETNTDRFKNNFLASANLKFKIVDGLTLDIMGSTNLNFANTNSFNENVPGTAISTATASIRDTYLTVWQNTNNLTYTNTFGDHSLTAMAVYEQQVFEQRTNLSNASGFITLANGYDNLGLAATQTISSGFSNSSLQSYMGRFNYGYKSRYMITATVRADGTSKFQDDNKYSIFPAFAGNWTISEESFMQDLNWLYRMKLRLGWGRTGNQAISNYETLQTLNTSDYTTTMDGVSLAPGVGPGDPANPALKWETTTQSNIGLDLSILDGRLNTSVDVYHKLTDDLLLAEQLPSYLGGGSIMRNVGEVENKGLEIEISGVPISTPSFVWNSSLNFNYFKNKVLELSDPDNDEEYLFSSYGSNFIIQEGEPLGQFYGYKYLGQWQLGEEQEAAIYGNVPGDARYEDLDDDGSIDLQVIGNGAPTTTWGWNNNFSYKGFDLNIFLQGSHGNDIWNWTRYYRIAGGAQVFNATSREVLGNIWSVDNQSGTLPGFSSTSVTERQSSFFVENGSFIRLTNVTLSYNLPVDFLQRYSLKSLQIYVSGTNLLTISDYSGYDPEVSSSGNSDTAVSIDTGAYPISRVFTLGLRLGL